MQKPLLSRWKDLKKVCAGHQPNKGLFPEQSKDLRTKQKETNNPLRKGAKDPDRRLPKRTYRQQIGTRADTLSTLSWSGNAN